MTIRPSRTASRVDPAATRDDAPDPLVDHLVYAAPDLDAAVARFRDITALQPAAGGRHIGLGTRNFLVGLGPSCYLEIVGPDLEHPADRGVAMPFGLDTLRTPRLVTWAIHPADIAAAVAASAGAGADLGAIREMQRSRPDGVLLQWRLAVPDVLPLGGVTPFVIDWGASPHPTVGDLPRATLLALRATHPDVPAVQRVALALGVRLHTEYGEPGLTAVVATPSGDVEIS